MSRFTQTEVHVAESANSEFHQYKQYIFSMVNNVIMMPYL